MKKDKLTAGEITCQTLKAHELNVASIDAGHLAIATWNGKTGADFKTGVNHLYSDKYRELWPEDQYPEKYEKDIPC